MVIRVLVDGLVLMKSLWEKVRNKSKIFVVSVCLLPLSRGWHNNKTASQTLTPWCWTPSLPNCKKQLYSHYINYELWHATIAAWMGWDTMSEATVFVPVPWWHGLHSCICFLSPAQPLVFTLGKEASGSFRTRERQRSESSARVSGDLGFPSWPRIQAAWLWHLSPSSWRKKAPIHPVSTTLRRQWTMASLCTRTSYSIFFSLTFQMVPHCSQNPHTLTVCLAVL